MSWVAAGVASGAATMAGVKYIKSRRDAKQAEKNRPKYEIPEEVKQNLSSAQLDALQGMPEEQKQQYLSNLQRSSAYALSQASSRRGGLEGLSSINQNQNDAYGNLMGMDAQARMQNKQNLYGQRQNIADYRDQAFQFNKVNPFYERIAQRRADDNELFQNLNNSAQMGMGSMGASGGGKQQQQGGDQMSSQYWNKSTGMQNYNPNSNNGYGDFNYNGQQYPNVG